MKGTSVATLRLLGRLLVGRLLGRLSGRCNTLSRKHEFARDLGFPWPCCDNTARRLRTVHSLRWSPSFLKRTYTRQCSLNPYPLVSPSCFDGLSHHRPAHLNCSYYYVSDSRRHNSIFLQFPHHLRRCPESVREKDKDGPSHTSPRNTATTLQLY